MSFLKSMREESTIVKAAAAANISRDTAYKYLKGPAFKAELDKRRSECLNDTVRFLQSKLTVCSEQLRVSAGFGRRNRTVGSSPASASKRFFARFQNSLVHSGVEGYNGRNR